MALWKNWFSADNQAYVASPEEIELAYQELQKKLDACQNVFTAKVGESELSLLTSLLANTHHQAPQDSKTIHQLIVKMRQDIMDLKKEAQQNPKTYKGGLLIEPYIVYKELLASDLTSAIEEFDAACHL